MSGAWVLWVTAGVGQLLLLERHAHQRRAGCLILGLPPRPRNLHRYRQHTGGKLAPPLGGEARLAGFPALVPTDVEVRGDSWKESSADVAIAGLGWVGVGVSGRAALRVWAPPGVAITTHDALVPDFARELERPGFGVALTDAGKSRVEEEARQAKAAQQQAAKEAKRAEREAKQAAKAKAGAGEA